MSKSSKDAGAIISLVAGPLAMVLILVAFILQMATPGIHISGTFLIWNVSNDIDGVKIIFGSSDPKAVLSWSALIAWIFFILTFAVLAALLVFDIIKFAGVEKAAKKMNMDAAKLLLIIRLAVAVLLIVAAIFIFIAVPTFASANDASTNGLSLNAGWIIAGILAILAAIAVPLPSLLSLKK